MMETILGSGGMLNGMPIWSGVASEPAGFFGYSCPDRKRDPLRILADSETCAMISPNDQDSESAAVDPDTTARVACRT